ncbi:MAG TPA: copper oxidase [Clostridiales bacterium]|nr:MAG: copper oxidase [Clostridiales bacterium GWD2_32_19]HCC06996.1 copper oxidase [Clostridiales bacterium]
MTQTFDLWADSGYFMTPKGHNIYFWGFNDSADVSPQLPGPTLIFSETNEIIINLHNNLPENVSLLFPGQENVQYKKPDDTWESVQPQFSGIDLISLTNYAPPGATITYRFTATNPGTFLYESGTNPQKQVHMGLYGSIVVRPHDFNTVKTAYGQNTGTDFDREYLITVAEIDPVLHKSVEKGEPYNIKDYKPRYWVLNGRCAPDTMLKNGLSSLPSQPYSGMIMMEPGEKVLVRYIDAGIENHPLHLHANHTRLVGLDGRILRNGSTDLSYKRFTILMGSGQTYDMIFEWDGLGYTPGNPIPTLLPSIRNLGIGEPGWTMWSGSPYLGEKKDIPVGVVSYNEMGEYHFMLHSHEEPQITNWGEFPGGMMSMLMIHPPGTLSPDTGVIRR